MEDVALKSKELARTKQELQVLKESQGEVVRRAEFAENRVKELEERERVLEGQLVEANQKIKSLEFRVVGLEDDLKKASEAGVGTSSDAEARIAELQAALQQSRKNVKEATKIANEARRRLVKPQILQLSCIGRVLSVPRSKLLWSILPSIWIDPLIS